MIDLILGTAGHIDHGKTSLILALTGTDTDRLPEEKKRGITIELGFAELVLGDYRLGVVDVPGHERFVRNMLAGATGIDLALLVVAADDSVKPQTREHLEILRLLRLRHGVIALTKCDLAEADWIDLVEDEVRELVEGTFLEEAPIIRTSAHTGQGVQELRSVLEEAARQTAGDSQTLGSDGPFRIAIDRTFTMAGHGTIITGSVSSGRARVGDELVIEPDHRPVRIRGLQNHDRTVEEVHRGQRAAINLAGVHHGEIRRGHELASPGHLVPSRLLTVRLSLLESASRPLKNRTRVRCHLGTMELLTVVSLLDRDRLNPGETAPAQLFLSEAAVSTWNQPFVVRSESPVVTIGGGQVLDPTAGKLKRHDPAVLERCTALAAGDPKRRAAAAAYFLGTGDWKPRDLARAAGIAAPEQVVGELLEEGELVELKLSPTRSVRVSRALLDELAERVKGILEKMHEQDPLALRFQRAKLAQRLEYLGRPLVDALLERMGAAGDIELSEKAVALAGHGPQLSKAERRLKDEIVETYREAGFQPPTVDEMRSKASRNQAAVPQLLALAEAEGELAKVSDELYLHSEADREMRERLRENLADGEGLTMAQIRDILGTSRKYAVPLCEYLDRSGFTRRDGDYRYLA